MFPAGIYYVQTRGLPCLYEQTCLSNSVCPLYVQTRGLPRLYKIYNIFTHYNFRAMLFHIP